MIIFVPDDAYEQEQRLREERKREAVSEVVKEYERILEEEKRGIHKTLEERVEENYYNSLGVEDQIFYSERRRIRKLFEELKQQRPA